ncbi:hypothetical protein SESBI_14586 [Sesbania bispinosa]|nr:hypothetical protein SESBI_14586 [Sesbania bispinosa]
MERVCALPSDVVYHVVELALQLLECNQDQARKNAALFFAAAFVFRAVLDAFDSQDGLQKLLSLLNDAALVRSGAPPVERYLHDLLQYALGVLHIVTLVPSSRKMIVNATLSNNRVGIAVILDATNIASSHLDPEGILLLLANTSAFQIIQPALNVLVNLVCPPPSISNKPPAVTQGQQFASSQASNGPPSETRDRNAEHRGSAAVLSTPSVNNPLQPPTPTATSALVGDRRISLGAGAGCAGLAAQLEQGYRQAREAVRANNGIKVLLHLFQPRIYSPPGALDCLRALASGPAWVGKKLSELIRDSGSQTPATEQGRWQAELSQAAIELIGIVTNSGRASTLAATDAATPTLRRIERAAIAAATPITYHSSPPHRKLLQHKFSGLLVVLFWISHQQSKFNTKDEDASLKSDVVSAKKKSLTFSSSFGSHSRHQLVDSQQSSVREGLSTGKESLETSIVETPSKSSLKQNIDSGSQYKTPVTLPAKRKLSDLKDIAMFSSSGKRLNVGDQGLRSPVCSSAIRKGSPAD